MYQSLTGDASHGLEIKRFGQMISRLRSDSSFQFLKRERRGVGWAQQKTRRSGGAKTRPTDFS